MHLSTYFDECEMKIQKQNYLSFSPGLFCISISDKREGEGKMVRRGGLGRGKGKLGEGREDRVGGRGGKIGWGGGEGR